MADTKQAELVTYIVAAKAVNVNTGRLDPQTRKPEVARVLQGDTINALPDNPDILTLLSLRAIIEADKVPAGRTARCTPAHLVKAFREANEHAMAQVDLQFKPIPAPAEHYTPDGAVTTDSLAE